MTVSALDGVPQGGFPSVRFASLVQSDANKQVRVTSVLKSSNPDQVWCFRGSSSGIGFASAAVGLSFSPACGRT